MNKTFFAACLTCGLLLTSINSMAEDIVATVNNTKITKSELELYLSYRQQSTGQKQENPEAVLNEMINRELLYAEAKKKKIDKNEDVKYLLEQQKRDLYIQALLSKSDVADPIKDEELQKIYDEKIKSQKLKEYNVKHIIVKAESDAKSIIAELDSGAVFEDIAKTKSTGPSAKEGGSIGWVNSAQLKQMPNFAQAVAEMKKGTYSKQPVQTNYGWHVIKLEDSRDLTPPGFDQVKSQIASAVRQQRLQAYVVKVRKGAKIDVRMK